MDREGKPEKVQAMHGYSSASEYVCVLHVKRVFVSPELCRVEKGASTPIPFSTRVEEGKRRAEKIFNLDLRRPSCCTVV